MVFCSIAQCGNSSAKCNYTNKGITFHRFPQDADTKDKWISATGKRNWFPTTNSRICSLHFTEDSYNISTKRRTLIKTAVPTINTWKLIINSTDNQQIRTSEFEPTVTDTTRKRKLSTEVDQQKRVIKEQRLKIKRLQCKTRRYRKTILRLKDLIKNLEDKRFRSSLNINKPDALSMLVHNISVL